MTITIEQYGDNHQNQTDKEEKHDSPDSDPHGGSSGQAITSGQLSSPVLLIPVLSLGLSPTLLSEVTPGPWVEERSGRLYSDNEIH